MFKFKPKNFIILVIILALLFFNYYNQDQKDEGFLNTASNFNSLENVKVENKLEKENNNQIIIHLSGGVINPGVYKLNNKERLIDLIKAAGGLNKQADLEKINLAEKLYDGQKVIIPLVVERNIELNSAGDSGSQSSDKILNNNYSLSNNQLININQANQTKLETLSGIGPSKAAAIIKYRNEINFFIKKEDLLNVSGIGEKTLEKIKDEIVIK